MKMRCCQCYKANEDGEMVVTALDVSIIAEIKEEKPELMDLIKTLNEAALDNKGRIEVTSFAGSFFINGSVVVPPKYQMIVSEIALQLK